MLLLIISIRETPRHTLATNQCCNTSSERNILGIGWRVLLWLIPHNPASLAALPDLHSQTPRGVGGVAALIRHTLNILTEPFEHFTENPQSALELETGESVRCQLLDRVDLRLIRLNLGKKLVAHGKSHRTSPMGQTGSSRPNPSSGSLATSGRQPRCAEAHHGGSLSLRACRERSLKAWRVGGRLHEKVECAQIVRVGRRHPQRR